MGNVHLVKPTPNLKAAYLDFYQEWVESGEEMVPWVISKDPTDFDDMLQYLQDLEDESKLPDHFVPGSTYWLIDENKDVVGVVNIRHRLNEKLLNIGGHIGYGIRPSARRKGYASKLLAQTLEITKDLGLNQVLVCCDKGNIGSEKTILKNGGVFESEFIEDDGNIVRRFWIELDAK